MNDLFPDLPKNPPKIVAFKERHQIQTHHSPGCEPEWCALHMPSALEFGYGVTATDTIGDCAAKIGRLLDESGVMGYGDTEADAIVETCKACHITVLPSDL
jgi:hypothetical protein